MCKNQVILRKVLHKHTLPVLEDFGAWLKSFYMNHSLPWKGNKATALKLIILWVAEQKDIADLG